MKSRLLLVLFFTLGITAIAQKSENAQPIFRGTLSKNGVYDGNDFNYIPESKWKFKTGGAVRSTPVYFEGKIYIGSTDGFFYCLDSKTGNKVWSFQALSAIPSTCAISKGKIFFTDKKNNLYCLQADTGKKIWQTDLKPNLPYEWGFDYYQSSPLVNNGIVYAGSGSGHMYAVNETDGKVKWSFKASSLVRSSPTLYQNMIYFGDLSGQVYAVNAATGEQKWHFATHGDTVVNEKYGNDYKAVIASAAVENNVAVIGGRDGYLYGLNATTGKEIWSYNYDGSWVLNTVAIKNNTVITGTSDGRVIQSFDLLTGKEKWKYKTPSIVWSSPIIVSSTIVAPVGDGFIHCLDFETGKEKYRYRFGDRAFSSPILHDNIIYIGNDDGYVSALTTGNKIPSGKPVKKAVFYTSDVMGKYVRQGMNNIVRDYFVAEGYELLNEEKLASFLKANATSDVSSVVVFAAGYFPQDIVKGGYRDNTLYNYLKQGGKVVILGVNPAFHQFDYVKNEYKGLSYLKSDSILGVSYKHNDLRSHYGYYSSIPTETGKKWSLSQTIPTYAGADPSQVTPLSMDENGRAAYWVKNYGHKEGTGFVQLWIQPSALNLLSEIRRIAEFGIE